MKRTAIYPGSFDPLTNGHEEIIRKASKLFDEVTVVVGYNSQKDHSSFTVEERVDMIAKVIKKYPNVKVDSHNGLIIDYAEKVDATAIVKGIRNPMDFNEELTQYHYNHSFNKNIETVVLLPDVESLYISSSAVKVLADFGHSLKGYVPKEILKDIEAKLLKR